MRPCQGRDDGATPFTRSVFGDVAHQQSARLTCERQRGQHSSFPPFSRAYHKDLVVDGVVPTLAEGLLDAAQSAWVFGGMGSWNDMGFEGADQAEYDRVSQQLFTVLNETIQIAANASCAARAT